MSKKKQSTAIAPAGGWPQTEAEVIDRLKNKPNRIKAIVTQDGPSGHARHWVSVNYEFKGTIKSFGQFLYGIACDVEQAGGVVTRVELRTDIRPMNDHPDNYDPHGNWSALHVDVSIRTRIAAEEQKAAWEQAVRDLFSKGGA